MKIVLGLLLALLKLPGSIAAGDDDIGSPDKPCRARAWVRAPDLDPGQVVQGDVKVKLDGACPAVLSYTLKLRFAERSWVKTRRQGVQLPERPTENSVPIRFSNNNRSIFEPEGSINSFTRFSGMDKSDWDKYMKVVRDPSSWLAREEERIGFEAKYDLCNGKQVSHDVVEPFAILVPSTAYPPGFNPLSVYILGSDELDTAGSEHIYAYAVDVAFLNGTILEVPAGYTSFNVPTVITPGSPKTLNVTVSPPPPCRPIHADGHVSEVVEQEDVDSFTLEVTFPHGRHFEQGSVNNLTVVSHGSGIKRPYQIWWRMVDVAEKLRWAASFAADNKTRERLLDTKMGRAQTAQLRPTNPLTYSFSGPYNNSHLANPRFLQDGVAPNGTMYSSKPITVQFNVPEDCFPNFDMHYQTIEAELRFSVEVRNVSLSNEEKEDTEEYDWTPNMRRESNFPQGSLHSARIPLFIHSRQDRQDDPTKSVATDNVHYLSAEARAPVFVDPGSVQDLLEKSMNERDALTPKAHPKFITREGGDVVKDRYFTWGRPSLNQYYVGDTWFRKVVLPRERNEAERLVVGLRIQS